MRRYPTMTFCAVAALVTLAATARNSDASQRPRHSEEMTAREESRQTYEMAPGASLRAEGIAGPVTIETGDFARAELHIVRMAATRRELDCYQTRVSATRTSLTIEHVQDRDRAGCDSIRSRQEVHLRLPRSMSVDLESIAGAVEIGPVDGMVRLSSIAGRTTLARVRSADIGSIAGPLTIGMARIGQEGIEVSSVTGPIELRAEPGLDADVRVDSVIGQVSGIDWIEERGAYHARLGQGGGRVSLSSIVGSVRLRRP